MRHKLRLKILAGFGLLIAMLFLAGTISIIEFTRISRSVNSLINDNYKTINATKTMLEALEREDSGILLLILGQWKEGRSLLESSDSVFNASLDIARNNITEHNENEYVRNISHYYQVYRAAWERPIVDTDKQGNINWYQHDVHRYFLEVKNAVDELMTLNQSSMYNEASLLREKAKRAIMPGIISIAAALIFSLLLNFFISRYFVSPIVRLKDAVQDYNPSDTFLQVDISSEDEIKMLEDEINQLIRRLS
jgi:nitrate/nitrite-specific signal transduction histidine kinase